MRLVNEGRLGKSVPHAKSGGNRWYGLIPSLHPNAIRRPRPLCSEEARDVLGAPKISAKVGFLMSAGAVGI